MPDILQLAKALVVIEEEVLRRGEYIVSISANNLGGQWDIIVESTTVEEGENYVN